MASAAVYTGRWTDYSLTGISQDVVTLNVRDGAILIAALSTFIGLVGTSFWSLIAFWIHQSRAQAEPQDGFYFQQQALYRNTGTPVAALSQISRMCLAWRKRAGKSRRVKHLKTRSFVLALPPLITFLGFTAAGVFVSKVAGKAYNSNDVLLKSGSCGGWIYNTTTIQGEVAAQQKIINETAAGRQYASTCYDQANTTGFNTATQCDLYAISTLPFSSTNVACPFGKDPSGDDLCLPDGNTAHQMSTPLLDSNEIFGINAPPEDRITVSKSLTCAPLHIKNYVTISGTGSNAVYVVNLGPIIDVRNYTYAYNAQLANLSVSYQLASIFANNETWIPAPALRSSYGDVSAYILASNAVRYLTPVDDLFYLAHTPLSVDDTGVTNFYTPNSFVAVMGCIDQYQICNPNNNPASCTIQGSLSQMFAGYPLIGLNPRQTATALVIYEALVHANTYQSVNPLGPGALLARNKLFGDQISIGLPANQWQLEVESWFKTSLAKIQAFLVDYVSGTADLGPYGRYQTTTNNGNALNTAAIALCSQQRIRNTGAYQTFSFLGLLIIAVLGATIILLNWIVEPLVGCCRSLRKSKRHDHKEIARIADRTLQLQRMALMKGQRNECWDHNLDAVPVTRQQTTFSPAVRTIHRNVDDYEYAAPVVPAQSSNDPSTRSAEEDDFDDTEQDQILLKPQRVIR